MLVQPRKHATANLVGPSQEANLQFLHDPGGQLDEALKEAEAFGKKHSASCRKRCSWFRGEPPGPSQDGLELQFPVSWESQLQE